jgi:hypothetical protein
VIFRQLLAIYVADSGRFLSRLSGSDFTLVLFSSCDSLGFEAPFFDNGLTTREAKSRFFAAVFDCRFGARLEVRKAASSLACKVRCFVSSTVDSNTLPQMSHEQIDSSCNSSTLSLAVSLTCD